MKDPIISVSGLRGIVGSSLTPDIADRYISAFADTLPEGPVVVTYDGRTTGPMLATTVQSALMAKGRTCLNGGIAATPTIGVLVRDLGAAGGVQISASHNPPEYNGLKLIDGTGRVIPSNEGKKVLDRYLQGTSDAKSDGEGKAISVEENISAHLNIVAGICDVEAIKKRRVRVLLDANHGSGSVVGVPLLEHLGCDVTVLGGDADGQFAHPAEPTNENLLPVVPRLKASGAEVAFCQDPDADRLAVMDETGRYLGEEFTLAMCVDHVLRSAPGPVVTNCSTSRMTQDLAEKYAVAFHRSQVGEANVVDLMLAERAVLGGEGNGGVIDPRVGFIRDSFAAMALLLDAMVARQLPISSLADELPQYAIHKTKVELAPQQVPSALDALESHFGEASADRLDGLRLDWPDKWLLIRASNTEPIVRLIAEAPTMGEAKTLCDLSAQVIGQ